MNRRKLLIIKHGYSETCDHSISPVVSFGDVFRCTCLLESFMGWHVIWITAPAAEDLLAGNHLIDELILANSPQDLGERYGNVIQGRYDIVVNLEKQKDWCEFTSSLNAREKFGFKDWATQNKDAFYEASASALDSALQREGYHPLQETLFKTIGREWTGQRYSLGYHPRVTEIYDIGLNNNVGPKWPTKKWPQDNWQQLYEQLSRHYAVSWQQSLNSIRHYIDWLASCRLIITCDSLGLHLSLALRKNIVALFGPTPPEQVYMYGQGIKLTPSCLRTCVPCFQPRCDFGRSCMEYISVDMVLEAVDLLLNSPKKSVLAHGAAIWNKGVTTDEAQNNTTAASLCASDAKGLAQTVQNMVMQKF